MYGLKVSLFDIHGGRSMEVNMCLWMCWVSYRNAISHGYAVFILAYFTYDMSIITFIVSFVLIFGGHRDCLLAFRCLKQIFTDLF